MEPQWNISKLSLWGSIVLLHKAPSLQETRDEVQVAEEEAEAYPPHLLIHAPTPHLQALMLSLMLTSLSVQPMEPFAKSVESQPQTIPHAPSDIRIFSLQSLLSLHLPMHLCLLYSLIPIRQK